MTTHRRLALAAVVLLGTPLSACADGGGGGGGDQTAASTAPTESASETSDGSTYLPVPDGVELTEPGSALTLKETATGAWTPRQDLVGVVDVAVTRLRKTTVAKTFDGYALDDVAQASTPYFVFAKVTNAGDTDLGGRRLPLYVIGSGGGLLEPTGIAQDFAPCPGAQLPAIFAPGDKANTCLVFLAPSGSTLTSVMFRPPEGVVPVTWTGDVKPLKVATNKGRGKKGQKGQKGGQ